MPPSVVDEEGYVTDICADTFGFAH
jgi:hypothetical protein